MRNDGLITQDELDFILDLQSNPKFEVRAKSRSLTVNGGIQISDLLTRLAANEQVTLQAQFEKQQMTFPLHLVEDEFHALHLELGAPSIYEEGPKVRPWRLPLPSPIALQTEQGTPTSLWVHEISFKGVLLENRRHSKPPKRFSALFAPEGQMPIALSGTLERITEQGLAAYRFSQRHKEELEHLRQYILQQHRQLHPALHA